MYKIIGADGKEYGPISAEIVKKWIAEGRANATTRVLPEGATNWVTVADVPELAAGIPGATSAGAGGPPNFGPAPTLPSALDPRKQVSGPAIGLIVSGSLYLVAGVFRILSGVFSASFAGLMGNNDPQMQKIMAVSGVVNWALAVLVLVLGGLVIWGGIKMKQLENYGLCMTAAIISVLPCSFPCCLIGMPFGIWALVILSKPEVKAQFT